MKLHLQRPGASNQITGYENGQIRINETLYLGGTIVAADLLINPWGPESIAGLDIADLDAVRHYDTEILLLGTGLRQRFPDPALFKALRQIFPGMEIMDTPAACRTYNILMGEERRVVAALLPG